MVENQNQELLFKLSMLEQQIRHLQQQFQAVEESINEMNLLNLGLDEIKNSTGKEVLAPLGRGIFVETRLLSDRLTVDVGGRNFVKKSVPETKEIIDAQIKKLNEVSKALDEKIEEINEELTQTIMEAQENQEEFD